MTHLQVNNDDVKTNYDRYGYTPLYMATSRYGFIPFAIFLAKGPAIQLLHNPKFTIILTIIQSLKLPDHYKLLIVNVTENVTVTITITISITITLTLIE